MVELTGMEGHETDSKVFCRVAGVAAIVAGLLFRRNFGIEISLFNAQGKPVTVEGWFALLQHKRLLGLAYLDVFDVVNYALVGLMFLALYITLKRTSRAWMSVAAVSCFLGIAVYFSTNMALSMLPLSDQYAAATTEAQRSMALAAGQALLAITRFGTPGAYPGTGGFVSLLLVAFAGLITSIVMLRSGVFNRTTAYIGILACGFDLAYCFGYILVPAIYRELVGVCFIPAAGLFLMIWHTLVGGRLYQLGRQRGDMHCSDTAA